MTRSTQPYRTISPAELTGDEEPVRDGRTLPGMPAVTKPEKIAQRERASTLPGMPTAKPWKNPETERASTLPDIPLGAKSDLGAVDSENFKSILDFREEYENVPVGNTSKNPRLKIDIKPETGFDNEELSLLEEIGKINSQLLPERKRALLNFAKTGNPINKEVFAEASRLLKEQNEKLEKD